jgi:hypothetical protein
MIYRLLLNKYRSINQIKKTEMGRAYGTRGDEGRCMQGFGGETWGKRPLGAHRRKWEYNIKIDLRLVGWGHGVDVSGSW